MKKKKRKKAGNKQKRKKKNPRLKNTRIKKKKEQKPVKSHVNIPNATPSNATVPNCLPTKINVNINTIKLVVYENATGQLSRHNSFISYFISFDIFIILILILF